MEHEYQILRGKLASRYDEDREKLSTSGDHHQEINAQISGLERKKEAALSRFDYLYEQFRRTMDAQHLHTYSQQPLKILFIKKCHA